VTAKESPPLSQSEEEEAFLEEVLGRAPAEKYLPH